MKKSQILAALALAFALGVVAPVAGVNAIEPRVNTGATAEKSATNDNLKSAVNYVTSNETYKAFAKLAEAKEAATATGIKDVTAANTALTDALRSFTGATTTSGTTVAAMTANTTNLKNAVGTNYSKYAALYDALNADAAKIGSDEAIKGVEKAMQELGYTFEAEEGDDFDTVKTAATDAIDADDKVENWSVYSAAVVAVKDAEVTYKAFDGLQKALSNTNLGLTKAQAKTVSEAQTIAALTAVTPADAADWANVAKKITAIETAIKNENGTTNAARYALLDNETAGAEGLLQLMQVATDNEDLTYAQLISAAPIINNPDEPGTDQPGTETPGDDTKDPSAPGTGLVGTAEGNAATTVSIVAGLATALTALGAGVVAYRSARRSNK